MHRQETCNHYFVCGPSFVVGKGKLREGVAPNLG